MVNNCPYDTTVSDLWVLAWHLLKVAGGGVWSSNTSGLHVETLLDSHVYEFSLYSPAIGVRTTKAFPNLSPTSFE